MQLTRDMILEADDCPRERVEVPEWGGYVFVRTMTGSQRDAFESQAGNTDLPFHVRMQNLRARLAALTLCDERGQSLFTEADIIRLGAKSCEALDRIFKVAQRMNGLSAEDIDEIKKNLEHAQNGASGSD
jgi:hypothetical protein